MSTSIFVYLPIFCLSSYFLTLLIRKYAIRFGLQDVPNLRSSHHTPMPRGGGLSIVICVSVGIALLLWQKQISQPWVLSFLSAGALVALIGFKDDYSGTSAEARLGIHIAAAAILIALVNSQLSLTLHAGEFAWTLPFAWMAVFIILDVVWMINLYNFMDGIDGLAGGQCASVAAVLGLFAFLAGAPDLGYAYALLFASSLGFLALNWQPAKIFMGDVASGYIGFCFALLGLWGEASGRIPWVTSTILMGVFVVDTTYTLFQRALRKQKVFQAHRDHAYQKWARSGWSHSKVTTAVILINLLWLTPWGWISLRCPTLSLAALLIAWSPLVAIARISRAGVPTP